MQRGRNKEERAEKKIQEEIRRRVLDESRKLEERRESLEDERFRQEALEEMSGLSREEIERISREVRSQFGEMKRKPKKARSSTKAGQKTAGGKLSRKNGCLIFLGGTALIFAAVFIIPMIGSRDVPADVVRRAKTENEGALINAAREGNLEMVMFLVEKEKTRVNIEQGGYAHPLIHYGRGGTPLENAAFGGHQEVVEYLVSKGADAAHRAESGYGALSWADGPGDRPAARFLGVRTAEAFPEDSPVRKLWQRGITYSGYGFIKSVKENDIEAVGLFLEAGMDVNCTVNAEFTALTEAVAAEKHEMVRLLVNRGEGLRKDDVNRNLLKAADRNNLEMVKALMDGGADVNFRIGSYDPVLFKAGDPEVIRYLLENGADPNVTVGNSTKLIMVLYSVFYNGHRPESLEVVKMLLGHGADPNIGYVGNRHDQNAQYFVKRIPNKEYERLLSEAGGSK